MTEPIKPKKQGRKSSCTHENPERYKNGACKLCCSIQHKRYRSKVREYINERTRNKKNWIIEIKSKTPCMDCGIIYHYCQMDFDHRPGEIKVVGIGTSSTTPIDILKKEIAKCDLVCSNCHRLRTWKRHRGLL